MVEIFCEVIGSVQGVAFRAYVQESATELKLLGSVRNMPNGSVQVVAQGTIETLREFIEYLHEGSLLSVVDGVAVEWRSKNATFSEFSVLH